jgi:hypothetical protein
MGWSQALGWQEFALIKLKLLYTRFVCPCVPARHREPARSGEAGGSVAKLKKIEG